MTDVRHFVRLGLPVLVLAAVGPLLALRFGGYHVRTSGMVVLGLALWACVLAARGRLSAPRSVGGVATLALVGLAAWTTLSMVWADASTHEAWVEAVRALGAAAAFVLGGALLANARAFARFAAWTGAGIALVGLGTAVRILVSDAPLRSFTSGRLDWPVGYAPGLAALYLLGALLLLGVSCAAEQAWRETDEHGRHGLVQVAIGGAALGGAGACGALSMLAQSRGTLPAIAVALVVALLVWPGRAALLLRLLAVGGTLFASRTALGEPYRTQFDLRQAPFTEGADADALLELARQAAQHAAGMVVVCALVLGAVGAALVALGGAASEQLEQSAHQRSYSRRRRANGSSERLVIGGAIALAALVLTIGLLTSHGWIGTQWRSCTQPAVSTNDPGSSTSYFATTGTGRCDYYRVALGAAAHHPLLGVGAGNFRGEYVRERRTAEEPRVVHSLPLQLLAELGIIGAALGAAVLGCVLLAAWRFATSGPARDPAFAGAVAAIAYWTTHASIDWLWQLPAVTLPVLALAGGLVACVSPGQGRVRPQVAGPLAAGAMLATLALVLPVTMADRALRQARDPERSVAERLDSAHDAQSFDPGWAEPYVVEGSIASKRGDRQGAARAGREAVAAEPRSWSVQLRASGLIGLDDTAEGRTAFLAARSLNPRLPSTLPDRATNDPDSLQAPDA